MIKKRKRPRKRSGNKLGKKSVGRPSKYETINITQVEKLAGLGLIDEEIADILGIAHSTLDLYKTKHPEFSETIKRGKLKADAKVIQSLFKKATGYDYQEVTNEPAADGKELVVTKIVKKHTVPSDTAIFYWLQNRRRDQWKYVGGKELPLSGGDGTENEASDFTEDEKRAMAEYQAEVAQPSPGE